MWRNKDPVPDGSFQAAKSNSQNQEQFSLFRTTKSWKVRNQVLRLGVKISLTAIDWSSLSRLQSGQLASNLAWKSNWLPATRFRAIFHTYLFQRTTPENISWIWGSIKVKVGATGLRRIHWLYLNYAWAGIALSLRPQVKWIVCFTVQGLPSIRTCDLCNKKGYNV